MSDELVERLRSMHWCVTTETNGVGVSDRKVALEAADRISALQAQNLRLSGMCYDLTAERDSYRKALEDIIKDYEPGYPLSHDVIKYVARAALKGESHE